MISAFAFGKVAADSLNASSLLAVAAGKVFDVADGDPGTPSVCVGVADSIGTLVLAGFEPLSPHPASERAATNAMSTVLKIFIFDPWSRPPTRLS